MEIKTYRAASVQEALALVRADLGPDAAVLHTREVAPGMLRWLGAGRQIEVLATTDDSRVPSRLVETLDDVYDAGDVYESAEPLPRTDTSLFSDDEPFLPAQALARTDFDPQSRFRQQLADTAHNGVELSELAQQLAPDDGLARLYAELLAEQWPSEIAADFVERVRSQADPQEHHDSACLRQRVAKLLEAQLPACRQIVLEPGEQRIVALVGPTGVGKTTTIAKLGAEFRVRQRKRVGLVTVDTYRIAAVEQLRTYADILDLPMEVVATPREMRGAIQRMADLDLIMVDTAGRSPRDAVQLQELKAMLAEARAHEAHLVLSTVASSLSLTKTIEQFHGVGITSLVLTKFDEAHGLGHLIDLLRTKRLPISYVTHGQNVPDDIAPAARRELAMAIIGRGGERDAA